MFDSLTRCASTFGLEVYALRGPKLTHPIHLSDATAARLRRIIRAHTTAQTLVVRAQIVITAHDHPDWNHQQIAQMLGTRDRMVRKWRRRWVATQTLENASRSGAPRRFPP